MRLKINSLFIPRLIAFSLGICFLVLMCLSTQVCAEQKKISKGKPALWQIQGKKIPAKSKVYLFGSFEPLPKNYQWYDGKIKEAFEGSDELVLEVILTPGSSEETTRIVTKYGFLENKKNNLAKLLDRTHYQKMIKYSRKLMKLPERTIRRLKPWAVAHQLMVRRSIEVGMDLDYSAVRVLREKAIMKKIPVIGLDSLKQVWDVFLRLDLDLQAKILIDTIDQMEDYKNILNKYKKVWGSGDKNQITELFIGDINKFEGLPEAMILDRNHYWMPAIEKHIHSGKNIFLSLNISNLVGPYSLIRILEDDGYKVTKIQ